jgi:hypothetical protein
MLQNENISSCIVPLNVAGPVCVSTPGGIHVRSSGCCKVSPEGVGGSVTVKTKVPKLRILKVTVVKPPLKDSGVALKRQWMGRSSTEH